VQSRSRQARDLKLLDAVDSFGRETPTQTVWRISPEERDPLLGRASNSRWCDGSFDVLYTSFERNGALAEIYALLSAQPVFPSKPRWFTHQIKVSLQRALKLPDIPALGRFGVDPAHYGDRDYSKTQTIADAAHFLGFDGLIVPSARWDCFNAVLFTDLIAPENIALSETETSPIDWDKWRQGRRS
jgi:hypothetical protein